MKGDKTININFRSGSGWGGLNSSYPSSTTQGGGHGMGSHSRGSNHQSSLAPANYWGSGNSQGLGKVYDYSEVLGTSGHTGKNPYGDSETIDHIITFCRRKSSDCWGSNALHHGSGGSDGPLYVKAINLGKTDIHDKDAGNLFYVLRDFNFSLDIINLSSNQLGNLGVESMIYGITSLQYQTLYNPSNWQPYQSTIKTVQNVVNINLSNNQIGDDGAKLLAQYLANGSLPNLKYLDVSGNNISYEGNSKFAQAAKNTTQTIKILTNRILSLDTILSGGAKQSDLFFGSKEQKQAIIKSHLQQAQSNGVAIQNVGVSKSIFDQLKNNVKLSFNFQFGFIKCNIAPEDTTSLAVDIIIAKASTKVLSVKSVTDAVACYFEAFNNCASSQEGIQFMLDAGIVTETDLLGNVE